MRTTPVEGVFHAVARAAMSVPMPKDLQLQVPAFQNGLFMDAL